jgi:3-hydroxyacyl-CoA dehydrogenase
MPAYGIFEHPDAARLDMAIGILDYVAEDLYNLQKAPNLYRAKVAHGGLGAKTGQGSYDWSGKSIDEVKTPRNRFVIEVLRGRRNKGEATGELSGPISRRLIKYLDSRTVEALQTSLQCRLVWRNSWRPHPSRRLNEPHPLLECLAETHAGGFFLPLPSLNFLRA